MKKNATSAWFPWPALIALCMTSVAWAQQQSTISDDAAASRIAWWRDAKFGLFMHWGVYSIPGRGEWVQWNEQIPVNEYAKLATQFNPDKFDPDAWAVIAKTAGMKYTVLTARHHDGFALFDDPGSDFTAMKSAAHRDFVAEYVTAVRKAGLHVGLYYVDWLGFNGVAFKDGWHARPKDQHYAGAFTWQDDQAVGDLRKLQPSIITNDRTDAPADFLSREGDHAMGNFDSQHPWELCTTLTTGAWGYQPNAKVKSLNEVIRLLVGAVGRDGNLLLNVGPRPDGRIAPEQVERLREVGDWLRRYGQSIYATRGGPYLPGDFGVSTYHDRTVYLHVLNATDKRLSLPALPTKILSCSSLMGGSVACKQASNSVEITLNGNADAGDTIIALTLASPAVELKPITTPVAGRAELVR